MFGNPNSASDLNIDGGREWQVGHICPVPHASKKDWVKGSQVEFFNHYNDEILNLHEHNLIKIRHISI